MRLLEKNEIDIRKADEQKREIDEGAKLARRIDELRKLESDEKARIMAWQEGILKTIQEETIQAMKERDIIISENRLLKAQNEAMRRPLDEEWNKVASEKEAVHLATVSIQADRTALDKDKTYIIQRLRDIEIEEGRISDLKHAAVEDRIQADKIRTKAENDAAAARNEAQSILARAELTNKLYTERELKVAIRERDVENKVKNADAYAQRLFVKEQMLKDLEKSMFIAKKELDGESNTKWSPKKGR